MLSMQELCMKEVQKADMKDMMAPVIPSWTSSKRQPGHLQQDPC